MANGVIPSRFATFALAPARIKRSAVSKSSRYTAQCSAVAPSTWGAFTSDFRTINVRTAALSPFITASATSLRPAPSVTPAKHSNKTG